MERGRKKEDRRRREGGGKIKERSLDRKMEGCKEEGVKVDGIREGGWEFRRRKGRMNGGKIGGRI